MKRFAAAAAIAAAILITPLSGPTHAQQTADAAELTRNAPDRFGREAVRIGDQDASPASLR